MAYKGGFHDMLYSRKIRSSPHGKLISLLYSLLKSYTVTPQELILCDIKKGNKALDIGCGDGSFCESLKNHFQKVIGIDISSYRIKKAKKIYAKEKNLFFQVGDFDK